MIQAIGLTTTSRQRQQPTVDDLTFEARPGKVTVLLGPHGAGKSSAVQLMLQLRSGRGVCLFRGRPLHRIPQPAREVGTLLGAVPGHPDRTARGHLRMMAAVAGVPTSRVDDVLEVVDLAEVAGQRLGSFSRGMDRRLGIAAALLGDPHTLVLDAPAAGLSPREMSWLHGLLRGFAELGGTVLTTTRDPEEAAAWADRIVTLEGGRLLADESASQFAQTRQRPRIAVLSPDAERLAELLTRQAGTGQLACSAGPVEVVQESDDRLSVYGSNCATVGDTAFRHGILVHRLTVEGAVPERQLHAPSHLLHVPDPASGARRPALPEVTTETNSPAAPTGSLVTAVVHPPASTPVVPRPLQGAATESAATDEEADPGEEPSVSLPPRLRAVRRGPVAPLRYELRRMFGVRGTWALLLATVVCAVGSSLLAARSAAGAQVAPETLAPLAAVLVGWPTPMLLLPPIALGAGVLGALAFGHEFKYPALAPDCLRVPRRLGLLLAKLVACGCVAAALGLLVVFLNAAVISASYGPRFLVEGTASGAAPWYVQLPTVLALTVGCAWIGLVVAGLLRRTAAGVCALLAVPFALAGVLQRSCGIDPVAVATALPARVSELLGDSVSGGLEGWIGAVLRVAGQPQGQAVALGLMVLLSVYLLTTALRTRAR